MKVRLLVVCFALLGCGGSLPTPAKTEHPLAAFKEVPYPPPAALAETVSDPPKQRGAVWVDGEWIYRGGSYVWRRGGWVVPPQSSRFATWRTFYRRDGRLMMANGTWYDTKQRHVRAPEPVVPAATPPNNVTSEFQTGR